MWGKGKHEKADNSRVFIKKVKAFHTKKAAGRWMYTYSEPTGVTFPSLWRADFKGPIHFSLEGIARLRKVKWIRHMMYFFHRDNGKLLMLYQGFSKHSNFLSSQLDQTGLSVPILDRDPHQSNNTGSHRLVICQYLVGTWNTETSRIKNIFSHRIWWQSKILFVPPPFRFWETKWKHLSHWIRSSCCCSLLNEHFDGYNMGVVIIVLREKERGGSNHSITPEILWAVLQISSTRWVSVVWKSATSRNFILS